MRIDAYTHFIPGRIFEKLESSGKGDIVKRMRGVPSIYDLDIRRKIVDKYDDYAQILSYPMPPLEILTQGAALDEYAKLINDGFVEICEKYRDQFPGWVAQVSMAAPDTGIREAKRALAAGALGVQIYTNVSGRPLDDPAFADFFAEMEKTGKPIWMHPVRAANSPDYLAEKKSRFEIWWALGWSYETAAAMARLVFSGIMDRHPKLKIITHHFGGIAPMLEGRLGYGWDQLGARTSDEDLGVVLRSLKKRPLDYFKHSFYADTAVFGGAPATKCGFDFFDLDKILFASDCPFDPEKGTLYIRETLRILDELNLPKADRARIDYRNLEAITGVKFVK